MKSSCHFILELISGIPLTRNLMKKIKQLIQWTRGSVHQHRPKWREPVSREMPRIQQDRQIIKKLDILAIKFQESDDS